MNRVYTVLLILLMLVGCAPIPEVDDNHGYGYHYDYVTPAGVAVRNTSTTYIPRELIDSYYRQLESCVGILGPSDILIVFQDTPINGTGDAGYAYFDTGLAIVRVGSPNPDYDFHPIIMHEMLHIFLAQDGYSHQLNRDHVSDLFRVCR